MLPISIAVNFPIKSSVLTYMIKEPALFKRGALVEVPLGKRKAFGCMLSLAEEKKQKFELKEITKVHDWNYVLSENEILLYEWMSRYYHYSLGQLIFDCLPKMLKRPKKIEFLNGEGSFPNDKLTGEQLNIFKKIEEDLCAGFSQHYLHGVTGSGKTFIYLHLIQEIISNGKSVLFLLPEINLTPQFVSFFKEVLSCPVVPYHSALSNSEKFCAWNFLKDQDRPVFVLGVRSSVFLPVNNLGIIIVDEEHDSSFKQNDRCVYQARDVAVKKAQIENVPILMGSATPSVESYKRFKNNNPQNYYTLKERVRGSFPTVELISQKNEDSEDIYPFTKKSLALIEDHLQKGEQVLVFVNRLGFSNFLQCRSCAYKFMDPQTDTPLRYFKNKNILSSAHSEFSMPVPKSCPECQNMKLLNIGFGTEKAQELLQEKFRDKRIARFDRELITTQTKLEECLDNFHQGKTDILVGTQMLSKGHNFKNVNCVIILGADQSLNFPDFRSAEKTYQLITQVLGRCGRFSKESHVYIQTLNVENDLFKLIVNHDFDGFYQSELPIREMINFPPFSRMAKIYINSTKRNEMVAYMEKFKEVALDYLDRHNLNLELLGPAPAAVERRKHQYTWYFTIKSTDLNLIHKLIDFYELNFKFKHQYSMKIDVDPDQSI